MGISIYDLRRLPPQKLSLLPALLFLLLSLAVPPSSGFTFRFSFTPSQCKTISAAWDGGSPPFTLLLLPMRFMPQGEERRVIFEKTVYQGREMAFDFPFPAESQFVAVMSDSTGFGTGGTSPVLTVTSSNRTSCLPTTPSTPQFYLYLTPATPAQCSPIFISWDSPRNPPVNIYGVIPQGDSFRITPNNGSGGGFDWTCNIPSGTPFFFVAGDGNGSGTGGSTDVTPVRSGEGSGCISAYSPRSTLDGGVGSVGPLPGAGGGGDGGTVTGTGTGVTTATTVPTDGGQNGVGTDGTGGTTAGANVSGGGGGGDGNTNGSGGGTINGPLDPTSIAGVSNSDSSPNIALIIGVALGLLALALLIALLALRYNRHRTTLAQQDNQRARLLAVGDLPDTHLPQSGGAAGANAVR